MQGFPKQILGSIEMRDKSCELFTVEVPLRFKYQAQMPAEKKSHQVRISVRFHIRLLQLKEY
jgi:hypothetical protein